MYKHILSYFDQKRAREVCKQIGEDADMFLNEAGDQYDVVFESDATLTGEQKGKIIKDYDPDDIKFNISPVPEPQDYSTRGQLNGNREFRLLRER